jgi:hypothetical protein
MAGVRVGGVKLLSDSDRGALWIIGQHGHSVAHIVERFHHSLVALLTPGASPVMFP